MQHVSEFLKAKQALNLKNRFVDHLPERFFSGHGWRCSYFSRKIAVPDMTSARKQGDPYNWVPFLNQYFPVFTSLVTHHKHTIIYTFLLRTDKLLRLSKRVSFLLSSLEEMEEQK